MSRPRHCWLRLRRHRPVRTGTFDFNVGWVYRCEVCGREVTPMPSKDQA